MNNPLVLLRYTEILQPILLSDRKSLLLIYKLPNTLIRKYLVLCFLNFAKPSIHIHHNFTVYQ